MTTLTDLSQLTKSMVKKPVEEQKPASMPKPQESPVDREAAEVLAYFARPGGNAPQRAHVASRADPAKDRVAELEAALEAKDAALDALAEEKAAAQQSGRERRAGVLAGVLAANPATGELERRRAELRQILKDAGGFIDASTLAALERIGIRCISGRKHWKLECADIRMPMSKTPSDYRSAQNCATDVANRCF